MSKNPTHTDASPIVTDANAVPPAVMAALENATFESDVGPIRLAHLSPAGALHFMAYGVLRSTRDASISVKAKAQALALKAVLTPGMLTDDTDKEELSKLEEAYDDAIENDTDKALLRAVARGFIAAVAKERGVKLSPEAIAEGAEAYLSPNGPDAPSFPTLLKVYGLVKGVTVAAKRARLVACIDGSIGVERPRKAAKSNNLLAGLGLFD